MSAIWFIGDEVTAAGYRLAAAHVLVPRRGDVGEFFAEALNTAGLVLVTTACAAELRDEVLDHAIRAADPLVLVVPNAAEPSVFPDFSADVRLALEIEP